MYRVYIILRADSNRNLIRTRPLRCAPPGVDISLLSKRGWRIQLLLRRSEEGWGGGRSGGGGGTWIENPVLPAASTFSLWVFFWFLLFIGWARLCMCLCVCEGSKRARGRDLIESLQVPRVARRSFLWLGKIEREREKVRWKRRDHGNDWPCRYIQPRNISPPRARRDEPNYVFGHGRHTLCGWERLIPLG